MRNVSNRKSKRGIIGPIADDVPSIFPIVFGVLLFTGTMVYALNQLGQRDAYLNLQKATLSLSSVVMESGYVSDAGFASACASSYVITANRAGIRALVTVKKFCPKTVGGAGSVDLSSNIFDVGPAGTPYAQQGLYCSSEGPPNNGLNYYSSCFGSSGSTATGGIKCPSNFIVLNFPIAVDCTSQPGNLVGVGMVNIIGWNG